MISNVHNVWGSIDGTLRNRGLCTDGEMALLIRALEMHDAIENRNLDSQAGPYTSGSGSIFSSITGKVLYYKMSERELRIKCVHFELPHVGLDKDTLVQNLKIHDIIVQSDADEGLQEDDARINCNLCLESFGESDFTIPPCCGQRMCTVIDNSGHMHAKNSN